MKRAASLVLALAALLASAGCAHGDKLKAFPNTGPFTPSGGGGGLSTVTTSAPASGDGSVGSPVTVRAATSSLSGYLAAADKAKLDTLSVSWASARASECFAAAPALTEAVYVKISANGSLTATALAAGFGDASVEGGAVKNSTSWAAYSTASVFQTPAAKSWCVAFRAALPVPSTGGDVADLGLVYGARSHLAAMGGVNSTDTTHIVLQLTGTGTTSVVSTTAIDGAWHNYMISFDGTTVKAWQDGVVVASQATLTNLMTDAGFPASDHNSATHIVTPTEVVYAYVSP